MSDLTLLESPSLDPDPDPVCSRISVSPGRFRRRPFLPIQQLLSHVQVE